MIPIQEAEVTQQAQVLAKETEEMLTEYKDFKIVTGEQYVSSGDILKDVKSKYNAIEDERKKMTRPLDEAKKRIMDFFRAPLERLATVENGIKRALLSYQQEQERIRQEQERKLREKAAKAEEKGKTEKADDLKMQAAAVSQMDTAPKVAGLATKTIWKFRVTDINSVPREYMAINEKMVQQVATATKGKLAIPGIEFYSEDTIAASTRR